MTRLKRLAFGIAALALGLPASGAADPDAPSNWDNMFRRDEPRDFARFPEDVLKLIDAGGGWYTQFALTLLWQKASASRTDRDDLLTAAWSLGGGWMATDSGGFSWWLQGGRPIGDPRDADLASDIGSILGTNATRDEKALYVRELYWAHEVLDKLRYSLGLIDSSYRYDFNTAANDDAGNFISESLVNSPVIPFPESGAGADLLWTWNETASVHAGVYQTNCDYESFGCLTDIDTDQYLAPAELMFRSHWDGQGTGNYRFLVYRSKKEDKSGNGFSMSLDQQFGSHLTAFLRAGFSDGEVTEIDRFISGGLSLDVPFHRSWDTIGLGLAHGRPADRDKRSETLIELYWRVRLNPFVSLTPDLQLILDPADNPEEDRIWVAGLRLQLDF